MSADDIDRMLERIRNFERLIGIGGNERLISKGSCQILAIYRSILMQNHTRNCTVLMCRMKWHDITNCPRAIDNAHRYYHADDVR